MVTLAEDRKLGRPGRLRVPGVVTAATIMVATVVLGTLGWVLPSPGGSLVIPTLIVIGIGCALGIADWIITGSRATSITLIAITALASVWTFAFSLPVSVGWAADATPQAQAAILQVTTGPQSRYGIPLHPCSTKTTGSIGPIGAPYRQCAVSTPEGHFVIFTSSKKSAGGLGYTDRGAATFPDECSRHLTGRWWMFTRSTDGLGGCPIGYQFHGGG